MPQIPMTIEERLRRLQRRYPGRRLEVLLVDSEQPEQIHVLEPQPGDPVPSPWRLMDD